MLMASCRLTLIRAVAHGLLSRALMASAIIIGRTFFSNELTGAAEMLNKQLYGSIGRIQLCKCLTEQLRYVVREPRCPSSPLSSGRRGCCLLRPIQMLKMWIAHWSCQKHFIDCWGSFSSSSALQPGALLGVGAAALLWGRGRIYSVVRCRSERSQRAPRKLKSDAEPWKCCRRARLHLRFISAFMEDKIYDIFFIYDSYDWTTYNLSLFSLLASTGIPCVFFKAAFFLNLMSVILMWQSRTSVWLFAASRTAAGFYHALNNLSAALVWTKFSWWSNVPHLDTHSLPGFRKYDKKKKKAVV